MDESEKNEIVGAFFAAAEAMVALEKLASGKSGINVVPFSPLKKQGHEANISFADVTDTQDGAQHPSEPSTALSVAQEDALSQVANRIMSTKTGVHAFGETSVAIKPGYFKIGAQGQGDDQASTLVFWEDLQKHQWMLDVLAELEAFASTNSLAETAEALVAARCEIISLAARSK